MLLLLLILLLLVVVVKQVNYRITVLRAVVNKAIMI